MTGILESGKGQRLPPLVCVEPAQVPIEGIFPARALSRVEQSVHGVTSQAHGNATGNSSGCTYVILANFSDENLILPKATIIGVAEEISESLVNKINAKAETNLSEPSKPPRRRKNEAFYNKLLQGKLDHLTPAERQHIEPILVKYAHVFHDEETNDFKGTTVIEHQIPVGDAKPITRPHIERHMLFVVRWNSRYRKCFKKVSFAKVIHHGLLPPSCPKEKS